MEYFKTSDLQFLESGNNNFLGRVCLHSKRKDYTIAPYFRYHEGDYYLDTTGWSRKKCNKQDDWWLDKYYIPFDEESSLDSDFTPQILLLLP